MPGGDGTGPAGMGPMTGRGAGFCAGFGMPGYANPVGGRGFWGWGRGGGGRGRRNWFYATGMTGWQRSAAGWPAWGGGPANSGPYAGPAGPAMTKEQEMDALKGQVEYLEDALDGLRKRMEELKSQAKE
ncbi:MAG: DUF5320 domain-containing protein [Phycisphaerae bacterium]|nr:DUF5320 domain-containing protein [Phycisphaerae bacterium]